MLALIMVGAGVYAGIKYVSRHLFAPPPGARTAERDAPAAQAQRDFETLEWDAESGVYRPSGRHRG